VATATFDGTLRHAGIGGDPVVILSVFDEGPFEEWHRVNRIFTQVMLHKDPSSGIDRISIYVTEAQVACLRDVTAVRITVDLRPEKRGNGMGVVALVASGAQR